MNYASYISAISFRFVQPQTRLPKGSGRVIKLLQKLGASFEVLNTRLPCAEQEMRRRVGCLCAIPRMSTFAIGAMINRGVAQMALGQAFVNVGVWNGFTLLAGMIGNPEKMCIGIDNFSEFDGPRDIFYRRFAKCGSSNHYFYDMDYEKYFSEVHDVPIGFYIYDGHHSYEHQIRGLQIAERFFAENCIILVDDMNLSDPRRGTLDFLAHSRYTYRVLLDRRTSANRHPTLWNGVMVLQRVG